MRGGEGAAAAVGAWEQSRRAWAAGGGGGGGAVRAGDGGGVVGPRQVGCKSGGTRASPTPTAWAQDEGGRVASVPGLV